MGFPSGSMVKNPPSNERRLRRWGFNPWVRNTPWRRKMAIYFRILSMDRGAWKVIVHGVTKSPTRLSD